MLGFKDNFFEKYFLGLFVVACGPPQNLFFRSPDRILVIFPLFSSLAKKIEAPDGTSGPKITKSLERSMDLRMGWVHTKNQLDRSTYRLSSLYRPKLVDFFGAKTGFPYVLLAFWYILGKFHREAGGIGWRLRFATFGHDNRHEPTSL